MIGAAGQLGAELARIFGPDAITFDLPELDITHISSFEELQKASPEVIINTAALRNTDTCEDEPENTFNVNAIGARNVGQVARVLGAIHVYISTDFIFDGTKSEPYIEIDPACPLSVYGVSKYAGELFTRASTPKHYILRVASLFGLASNIEKRKNFVETMLKLSKDRDELRIINDIIMSPTYTGHVATAFKKMLDNKVPFGIYHVVNTGSASWYEFTQEIFSIVDEGIKIVPVTADEFRSRAARPMYSVLSNEKLKHHGIEMPHWKDGLREYLSKRGD